MAQINYKGIIDAAITGFNDIQTKLNSIGALYNNGTSYVKVPATENSDAGLLSLSEILKSDAFRAADVTLTGSVTKMPSVTLKVSESTVSTSSDATDYYIKVNKNVLTNGTVSMAGNVMNTGYIGSNLSETTSVGADVVERTIYIRGGTYNATIAKTNGSAKHTVSTADATHLPYLSNTTNSGISTTAPLIGTAGANYWKIVPSGSTTSGSATATATIATEGYFKTGSKSSAESAINVNQTTGDSYYVSRLTEGTSEITDLSDAFLPEGKFIKTDELGYEGYYTFHQNNVSSKWTATSGGYLPAGGFIENSIESLNVGKIAPATFKLVGNRVNSKTSGYIVADSTALVIPTGAYSVSMASITKGKAEISGTITSAATTTKPSSGTDGTDYWTIAPQGTAGSATPKANITTAGYVEVGNKNGSASSVGVDAGNTYYLNKAAGTVTVTGNLTDISAPAISKTSATNANAGTVTTTKPTSGYYVAVQSAAKSGSAATLTGKFTGTTAGFMPANFIASGTGSFTPKVAASSVTYVPLNTASLTLTGSKTATTPTVALSSSTLTDVSPTVSTTAGTYNVRLKTTAPATSIPVSTQGSLTHGYLSASSQVSATASTVAASNTNYYVNIPAGTISSGTADLTPTNQVNILQTDSVFNPTITYNPTTVGPYALKYKTFIGLNPNGYSVAMDNYSISSTGITITRNVKKAAFVSFGFRTKAGMVYNVSFTAAPSSLCQAQFFASDGTRLGDVSLTNNQITVPTTYEKEPVYAMIGIVQYSSTLVDGVNTLTISRLEVIPADSTYVSNETVVPADGYLYIGAGYYPNTQISLADLIPDDSNYTNAGSGHILKGFEAYSPDGTKLIGTIETRSLSDTYYTTTNTGLGVVTSGYHPTTKYIKQGSATLTATASATVTPGSVSLAKSGTTNSGLEITGNSNVTIGTSAPTAGYYVKLTGTSASGSASISGTSKTSAFTAGWIASIANGTVSGTTTLNAKTGAAHYLKLPAASNSASATVTAPSVSLAASSETSGLITSTSTGAVSITVTPTVTKGSVTPKSTVTEGYLKAGSQDGTAAEVSTTINPLTIYVPQSTITTTSDKISWPSGFIRAGEMSFSSGTQAKDFSLSLTDRTTADLTFTEVSGMYEIKAPSITGTLTAGTSGYFTSGSATSSVVKVGKVNKATFTAGKITGTNTAGLNTTATGTTNGSIAAVNIGNKLTAATSSTITTGYFIAATAKSSGTATAGTVSKAGYIPTNSSTGTPTYSASDATTYYKIPAGACTVSGGGLSSTNYSGTPTVTISNGSSTNMASSAAAIITSTSDTAYPYYFKVNASSSALSGKTSVTRAAVTDAHTAGYIPDKTAATAIAAATVEPSVTVNEGSATSYVGLKSADGAVAVTGSDITTGKPVIGLTATLADGANNIAISEATVTKSTTAPTSGNFLSIKSSSTTGTQTITGKFTGSTAGYMNGSNFTKSGTKSVTATTPTSDITYISISDAELSASGTASATIKPAGVTVSKGSDSYVVGTSNITGATGVSVTSGNTPSSGYYVKVTGKSSSGTGSISGTVSAAVATSGYASKGSLTGSGSISGTVTLEERSNDYFVCLPGAAAASASINSATVSTVGSSSNGKITIGGATTNVTIWPKSAGWVSEAGLTGSVSPSISVNQLTLNGNTAAPYGLTLDVATKGYCNDSTLHTTNARMQNYASATISSMGRSASLTISGSEMSSSSHVDISTTDGNFKVQKDSNNVMSIYY